jgi:hypothetical protein
MYLADKINKQVLNATGFDVPELSGRMSHKKILEALRHQKRWHEDFSTQCVNQLDSIIHDNFDIDEILEE